jgi:hypothetical protein
VPSSNLRVILTSPLEDEISGEAHFIGGLTVFLREIFLAVASTRDSMR